MRNLQALVFGGCNIKEPMFQAARRWPRDPAADWSDVPTDIEISGAPFFTFTLGEMLQAMSCYRGARRIPPELRVFCHMKPEYVPTAANSPLEISDVALAEPNTSVEIEFDGYYLNRGPILQFLSALRKQDPRVRRLYSTWYSKGIVNCDDAARRDAAERLIPLIPDETLERDLTIDVLRHATGRRRDVHDGLARLKASLDMPLGIVAYTWAYMPDGRAMSWPAEFHSEVLGAAAALNLPLFDPRDWVERAGVTSALKPDLRHFSGAFMPIVAKPIIAFARSISSLR